MSTSTSAEFLSFDDRLAGLGVPPMSTFWREQTTRFLDTYDAGDALEFWSCAGRGGSKSTTLYKLALFFALFGPFKIPEDERHYAIVLSRLRDEPEKGINAIDKWLTKLGVAHEKLGNEIIHLTNVNRGIRIVAASVNAASGWRSFFVAADEYSKWPTGDGAAVLDADEVLTSARGMCATHPKAPVIVASTPWLTEGTFYDAITRGDGDGRIVAGPIPSWLANPAITEASTHARERNPRKWRREYLCEFQESFEGEYFPLEAIEAATDKGRDPVPIGPSYPGGNHIVTIDPAFSGDKFAICIAHAEPSLKDKGHVVVIDYIAVISPERGERLSPYRAVGTVCALRREWSGEFCVRSDQHEASSLTELFAQRNEILVTEPWSMQSKMERYEVARQLIIDGRLRLPDSPGLRRELASVGLKMTTAGHEIIKTRGGNDDRCSAFIHAVWTAHRQSPWWGLAPGQRREQTQAMGRASVYQGVGVASGGIGGGLNGNRAPPAETRHPGTLFGWVP